MKVPLKGGKQEIPLPGFPNCYAIPINPESRTNPIIGVNIQVKFSDIQKYDILIWRPVGLHPHRYTVKLNLSRLGFTGDIYVGILTMIPTLVKTYVAECTKELKVRVWKGRRESSAALIQVLPGGQWVFVRHSSYLVQEGENT